MKAKLFFSVVAMLSLVSCTEDIDIELKDEVSPVEKVVFSAFMENYAESRTGISDYPTFGYYSLFGREETLSVFTIGEILLYSLQKMTKAHPLNLFYLKGRLIMKHLSIKLFIRRILPCTTRSFRRLSIM